MLQFYRMMNSVPFVMHIRSQLPSDLVTISHAGISCTDAWCHCFNMAFSSVHAIKFFSSVSISVKVICILLLTFVLLYGSSSNISYLFVISLSKPDQVPPTFLPFFVRLFQAVAPVLNCLMSWYIDIWDPGHLNVACPNFAMCHWIQDVFMLLKTPRIED